MQYLMAEQEEANIGILFCSALLISIAFMLLGATLQIPILYNIYSLAVLIPALVLG